MSIYLYISIFIYIYILKKRMRVGHAFFSKERNVLRSFAKERCILLRSLQKNVKFFAFFFVLKKRMHHSFGFHKSPKTQKKKAKERCVL